MRITVLDRSNHHLFQPLLYQVATAALSPADIAAPIRRIFRHQRNVTVMLADVTAIDVAAKKVVLADGAVNYDILILATGATHAYFGHEAWAAFAPGLKTLKDALQIRQRVLLAFETAERETNDSRRRAWMTFVIVGGGPTGVELAGTLAEVSRQTLGAISDTLTRRRPGSSWSRRARACWGHIPKVSPNRPALNSSNLAWQSGPGSRSRELMRTASRSGPNGFTPGPFSGLRALPRRPWPRRLAFRSTRPAVSWSSPT